MYLVRNRIDNLIYAVKKVKLDNTFHAQKENDRILREVALLSRLHNPHIVRYYQAWIEEIDEEQSSENDSITEEEESSEEEEELVKPINKRAKSPHSASSYDFTISKAIPSGRPKYFDKDYMDDEDSDSSGLVFEKGASITLDKMESYSEKSQTVRNKNKLIKNTSKETNQNTKRRKLYIQMEY